MFHGQGNLCTYTHYVHTYWCHEDGFFHESKYINPLSPLVEGVNTEAVMYKTTTVTLAHVGGGLITNSC